MIYFIRITTNIAIKTERNDIILHRMQQIICLILFAIHTSLRSIEFREIGKKDILRTFSF